MPTFKDAEEINSVSEKLCVDFEYAADNLINAVQGLVTDLERLDEAFTALSKELPNLKNVVESRKVD
ncbi:MAG: hypothetical protein KA146_06955 [Leptospiraceae bacterium]|jgi:hypothetical protein|nr:hypothetical protein [Leptospiraceae bacterium]